MDSLASEDIKLKPFDFQNPPKVLQIRPATLVSRPPEKRKKRALPKLVVKETVASKARRYVIQCKMGCGVTNLLFKIS